MVAKKTTKSRNGSTAVLNRPNIVAQSVGRTLSRVPQIDAVFLLADETSVVHVFSVVREIESRLYTKLLRSESAVEKKFPGIAFESHVRAHQGREPAQAVPFEAELVYTR